MWTSCTINVYQDIDSSQGNDIAILPLYKTGYEILIEKRWLIWDMRARFHAIKPPPGVSKVTILE